MLPKRILCPLEPGESCSRAVLDTARDLAHGPGTELYLVHVVAPSSPSQKRDEVMAAAVMEAQRILRHNAKRQLCDIMERRIPRGMKAHVIIRQGETAKEIVRVAQLENADLIVLCSRSEPGCKPGTLGRIASEVVSTAPCRVLTVSTPMHGSLIDNKSSAERGAHNILGGLANPSDLASRFGGRVTMKN